MSVLAKGKPTMMSKKFYSMLLGGTLTMMVVSIMLMSDSFIAGAVIGPDAVAGVTLVTPLYSFAAFFGSVISLGVPILYAQEMGKFNKERADRVFGLGLLLSLVVGVILFILTSLFGNVYLRGYSPSEEILAEAQGYLSWIRWTAAGPWPSALRTWRLPSTCKRARSSRRGRMSPSPPGPP